MRVISKSLFLSLAVASAGLLSCSEDVPEVTKEAPDGGLVASINSKEFSSVQSVAVLQNGFISITSLDTEGNSLVLSVYGSKPGTYELATEVSEDDYQINSVAFNPANPDITNATFSSLTKVSPTGGWIKISAIDEESQLISGNFEVTVSRFYESSFEKDSVLTIEKGTFNNVVYTTEVTTAPENTFSGKIDGSALNPTVVSGMTSFGKLNLNFSTSSAQAISIVVPADITIGEYELSGMYSTYSATYNKDQNNKYEAKSGLLTIMKHDTAAKVIQGSFYFEAVPFSGSSATGTPSISQCEFTLTY